jgi:predicted dehydrogenase
LNTEFGGKAFDNLDAMLETGDVGAVIVAIPNDAHPAGVIAAAERGKHVLCEKPLAIDVADCWRMIEACDKAKVVLQVGFNQRFWNQVQIAKALVDAGFIGKIHQMRSADSDEAVLMEQNDDWQTQNRYMQIEGFAEPADKSADLQPLQITPKAA